MIDLKTVWRKNKPIYLKKKKKREMITMTTKKNERSVQMKAVKSSI